MTTFNLPIPFDCPDPVCPLSHITFNSTFIKKRQNDNVDLMIIVDYPRKGLISEHTQSLYPAKDSLLYNILEALDANIYLTSVLHCEKFYTKKDEEKEASKSMRDKCAKGLFAEIAKYNPKVIVCLGSEAIKSMNIQGIQTITKARRMVLEAFGGIKILTTFHPSVYDRYINSQGVDGQDLQEEYIRVFTLASKIYTGNYNPFKEQIIICRNKQDIKELMRYVQGKTHIAYDTEDNTNKLIPNQSSIYKKDTEILCASFSCDEETAYVVPAELLTKELIEFCLNDKVLIQSQIKHDIAITEKLLNTKLKEKDYFDTLYTNFSLDQSKYGNGLKDLVGNYLGIEDWSHGIWQQIKAKGTLGTFADVDREDLYLYNGRDSLYAYRLYKYLSENKPIPSSVALLHKAIRPLLKIEDNGLPINISRFNKLKQLYALNLSKNEKLFYALPVVQKIMAQENVVPSISQGNYTSPYFLRELCAETNLFSKFTTKAGLPRVDKTDIAEFAKQHNVWLLVQKLRDDSFLVSKFMQMLEDNMDTEGRLHTNFLLTRNEGGTEEGGGTKTGRLASSPNIQNLKKDKVFLSVFEAPKDYVFVNFDYSQVELRVMATLAKVTKMIQEYSEGKDLHTDMYKLAFNIPQDTKITKAQRQVGKTANFSIGYGIEEYSFMMRNRSALLDTFNHHDLNEKEKLFCLKGIVSKLFKAFFNKYPEIQKYMEKLQLQAYNGEMIVTPFGRQKSYQFTNDEKHNDHLRREIGNFTIQSTASDITLLKNCEIYQNIDTDKCKIVNTVHDSIWTVMHKHYIEEYTTKIVKIMEDASTLPFKMLVPLLTSVEVGKDLGHMTEFEGETKISEVTNYASKL